MMIPLTALVALLGLLVLVQRFLRVWWFHRQSFPLPEDVTPTLDAVYPVDGTVVYVREVRGTKLEVEKQGRMETAYDFGGTAEGVLIGVYMSVFDRHSIIAPTYGDVRVLKKTTTGRNLPMLDLWEYVRFHYFGKLVDWFENKVFGFVAENEKVVIRVGAITMVGIADRFVDKIDVFKDRQFVRTGDIIAHIRRGSQTDIFVPKALIYSMERPVVGQRVRAGERLCELC